VRTRIAALTGSGNDADRTEHHVDAEYTTDLIPQAVAEGVVADDGDGRGHAIICQVARTTGQGAVRITVSATLPSRT